MIFFREIKADFFTAFSSGRKNGTNIICKIIFWSTN